MLNFFLDYFLGAAHGSLSVAKLWSASEVRLRSAWEGALPLLFPRFLKKNRVKLLIIRTFLYHFNASADSYVSTKLVFPVAGTFFSEVSGQGILTIPRPMPHHISMTWEASPPPIASPSTRTGRRISTVVPFPAAEERVKLPPCWETISSATASPMPLPRREWAAL